jgi:hypothetical protein
MVIAVLPSATQQREFASNKEAVDFMREYAPSLGHRTFFIIEDGVAAVYRDGDYDCALFIEEEDAKRVAGYVDTARAPAADSNKSEQPLYAGPRC